MTTDPNAYIEVLARLLCAADVHVHDGDHPTWQQLRVAEHGRGQDDYRKAASWLQPKLTIAAETRLSRAERRCDELRAESKRRGKTVLEQSEKIRALEREVDGLQAQLGAEILRAAPAAPEATPPTEQADDAHRLALSTALGLGTSAPWDAIRERAAELAGQPVAVDRAAVLREEAARIRAHCPDHLDSDSAEGAWLACHCAVADDMLRRLAAETQPTEADRCPHGCDVSICPCLACEATTDEEDAPRREPHPTEADLRHALAVAAKFHGRDTGASVDPAASRTTEYRHTCHDQTSAPGRDYECQWCSTLPASLPAVVAEPGKEA